MLGDGCELRHAAGIADAEMAAAARLAGGLVRVEVLAADDPPQFMHPVIRAALEASLGSDERDRAHRIAARLLHADGAPPGQVAAHLAGVRAAADGWVLARLREAARAAMDSGAPQAAAGLLGRALAEPPPPAQRAGVLREAARAEASAGREMACAHLEEAMQLVADRGSGPRSRLRSPRRTRLCSGGWTRWMSSNGRSRSWVRPTGLAARLEGELVVCGLHDARRASRVAPVLARLASRRLEAASEPLAVAQAMTMLLSGPAGGPDRGFAGGDAGAHRPGG